MKINFIDLKAQYAAYKDEIDQEVMEVLGSAAYICGPKLGALENDLVQYTGAGHAIGCSSGTDALLLSLMALDIGPGDEVITSPFTFIATAAVISFLGATAVFVDIDEHTYNMDASLIEKAVSDQTRAIMPVSLFGQCSDMDAINAIADARNIAVIEDGAQSFGATYKGKKSCNLSRIGCTSFYPAKPLGCYGDGGAVFTSDNTLAEKIRMLLNHGQNQSHQHQYIGINGRLDEIQAAVLKTKLKYFDQEVRKRMHIARRYDDALRDIEKVTPPFIHKDNSSVYAQYSIRVKHRGELIKVLNDAGIPTAVHYPMPLHLQEAFVPLGYKTGDFPVAEAVSQEIMSLPMSPFLTADQQTYIVDTIKE